MSQMNPVSAVPSDFCDIHFNSTLPSMPGSSKWSPSVRVPYQNLYKFLLGSRKQQLQPSISFLGNTDINSILTECQKDVSSACRDSSVGIATRYGLDGPGIESRCGRDFPPRPDRPWGSPSLLYNGYRVLTRGKVAGAWR
jgi:hypothetical protein